MPVFWERRRQRFSLWKPAKQANGRRHASPKSARWLGAFQRRLTIEPLEERRLLLDVLGDLRFDHGRTTYINQHGSQTFQVTGMPWFSQRNTEWYLGDWNHENSTYWPTDSAPSYSVNFSTDGIFDVGADVYDGSYNYLESHDWYVIVDTQGPYAPGSVQMTPTSGNDTGRSQTDGITSNPNPQFQWSKPADQGNAGTANSYQWAVNTFSGSYVSGGTTSNAYANPGNLSDGRYDFWCARGQCR